MMDPAVDLYVHAPSVAEEDQIRVKALGPVHHFFFRNKTHPGQEQVVLQLGVDRMFRKKLAQAPDIQFGVHVSHAE